MPLEVLDDSTLSVVHYFLIMDSLSGIILYTANSAAFFLLYTIYFSSGSKWQLSAHDHIHKKQLSSDIFIQGSIIWRSGV